MEVFAVTSSVDLENEITVDILRNCYNTAKKQGKLIVYKNYAEAKVAQAKLFNAPIFKLLCENVEAYPSKTSPGNELSPELTGYEIPFDKLELVNAYLKHLDSNRFIKAFNFKEISQLPPVPRVKKEETQVDAISKETATSTPFAYLKNALLILTFTFMAIAAYFLTKASATYFLRGLVWQGVFSFVSVLAVIAVANLLYSEYLPSDQTRYHKLKKQVREQEQILLKTNKKEHQDFIQQFSELYNKAPEPIWTQTGAFKPGGQALTRYNVLEAQRQALSKIIAAKEGERLTIEQQALATAKKRFA